MRNKKYYREKINKKRLAYGNVGEKRFHEFLKRICKEMNLNVVRHPHGVERVDFIISDPGSEKNLLIEVERRKTPKWVNKFPYNTVDFYGRRVVRKNCLEVVLNAPCVRSLIYSHDVIENYKIEKIYGVGKPYYARQISTEHSKEFSLLKDVDKIKDIIYNAINGNLNNLNLNNKGMTMSNKKVNIKNTMTDALGWISENLSLTAHYLYYYRQIYSLKVLKKPKIEAPTTALLRDISAVYKNSNHNVENIIINNWSHGAGHIANEIVRTLEGGDEFLAGREKNGIVAKEYTKNTKNNNTFVSIGLQSVDVKCWWKNSIVSEDPIQYIKEKIKQHIKEISQRDNLTVKAVKDEVIIDRQLELPVMKESVVVHTSIQNSIAKNLSNEPKTSSHLSENVVFGLMEQLVALRKNNVAAFDKVIGLMKNLT